MSLKAIVGTLLAVVFASSVVTRAIVDPGKENGGGAATEQTSKNPFGTGHGLVPGDSSPQDSGSASSGTAEVDKLTEYLPMVTEASFFGLIGFALGYFSRKVVKVGLILIGIGFIAAQGLSYVGVVDIKWDRAIDLVNGAILDIKGSQSWKEIFAHKIPTMGALIAGYFVGFRKG